MTDDIHLDRRQLVWVAHHELGHAVTAHALGRRVLRIEITPGKFGAGYTTVEPVARCFESLVDDAVIDLAGYPAEWLSPEILDGRWPEADSLEAEAAAIAARIAILPPAILAAYERTHSSLRPGFTDQEKAEDRCRQAGGPEQAALLAFAGARASRIVGENTALIRGLAPGLFRDRIWTGDDFLRAIEELAAEEVKP